MIQTGLRTYLRAQVASVSNRVHPVKLPQDVTYPALTYQCISDPRDYDHGGADGTVEARYQITAWALTYEDAQTVKDELNTALSGYTGTLGSHAVALVVNLGGPDRYEDDADEDGIHSAPTDFQFQYEE